MAGTFPSSPGYSDITVTSNQDVISSRSEFGNRQARIVSGHRWDLKVSFPPMPRDRFGAIDGFIMDQKGKYGSFDFPLHIDNLGTWKDDSPLTVGVHYPGTSDISIDGLSAGSTIKAGDFVKFQDATGTHVKVHKVTADTVESGGAATINIMPPLTETLYNNSFVITSDIHFRVAIDAAHELKMGAPEIYKYELRLKEVM